jgi:hypothetical protein
MSDLISRKSLLNKINAYVVGSQDKEFICKLIKEMPSAQNKGEWKRTYLDHVAMGERPSILYCSVCCQCIAYPTNYCPNCGADMRGET